MALTKVPTQMMGAGAVLQVVNATFSTQISTSSTTFSDTGLAATITPSSSASKILVLIQANGEYTSTATTTTGVCLRAVRNSTAILEFEAIGAYHNSSGTDAGTGGSSMSYLDSPETTSAITYKLQFASGISGKSAYINAYGSVGFTSTSTITLMEIAA